MGEIIGPVLTQLAGQSPLLLAYVAGIVLALVYRRHYPTPSLLVLAGAGLLLAVTVGYTVTFHYLLVRRGGSGSGPTRKWAGCSPSSA